MMDIARYKVVVYLFAAAVLSSCATHPDIKYPSEAEIEAAEIGPPPANYENEIKAFISRTLKDPYSAVYVFDQSPQKRIARGGSPYGPFSIVWTVELSVNAKNSYGGYIGDHRYTCYFIDRKITECADYTQANLDMDRYLNR